MSRDVCKDLGGKNTFWDKTWDYDGSWRTKLFFGPSSFPPEPCSALTPPQPGRCSWAASRLSEGPPETCSHCLSANATSAASVVMHAVDKPGDWRASLHFFYFISPWQLKTSPNNTILTSSQSKLLIWPIYLLYFWHPTATTFFQDIIINSLYYYKIS